MDGPGLTLGVAGGTPDQISSPITTAALASQGRLKVDASARKGKKAILRKKIKSALAQ